MKTTKKLTLSAILSALAVIFLLVGSFIETVTFSAAGIASLCVIVAVCEIGYYYGTSVWIVASTLGILLLPVKDPVLYFACFFGYYPIVKLLLEKINSKIVYLLKGLVFSASYVITALIAIKFLIPDADVKKYLLLAFPVLLIVFFIFDTALSSLIRYYKQYLRKRLGIDKFLH